MPSDQQEWLNHRPCRCGATGRWAHPPGSTSRCRGEFRRVTQPALPPCGCPDQQEVATGGYVTSHLTTCEHEGRNPS